MRLFPSIRSLYRALYLNDILRLSYLVLLLSGIFGQYLILILVGIVRYRFRPAGFRFRGRTRYFQRARRIHRCTH